MGNRNPFRIAIDRANDWRYWGDVGPDAGDGDEDLGTLGPRGYDEVNQAKGPGFFGWPYCIADNIPYVRRFDSGNGPFDCDAPVNESPNNTGVVSLPPAHPAWLAYSSGEAPYPVLGSGPRTVLAGGIYRWQPGGSINKLPRYYDGSVFLLEYSRGFVAEVRTDTDGNITAVEEFLGSLDWAEPIHSRISANGVFYVAQFGVNSAVYRINYVGDNNRRRSRRIR
jgi:cytochrome c